MTKLKISTGGHGLDVHPNVSFWDRQGSWCPKLFRDHHSFLSMAWSSNTGGTRLSLSSLPPSIIIKAQPLSPQNRPSQLSDLLSVWNLFWVKLNPQSLYQPEFTVRVATYDASNINGKYFIFPEANANLTQNNSSWLMTKLLFERNETKKEYRGKGWDSNTCI